MAMAVVAFFYCLFVFEGFRELFRDSDAGWHIVSGQMILDTGRFPANDPFSFSFPGAPWFAWEWGADLVCGGLHRWLGLRGVTILFASTIGFCVWLWVRLTWISGGTFLLVCALLPLFLSTSSLHWLARPHVFSWPFLLGTLWVAESPPLQFRPFHAVILIAATAVWSSMHASFFLAPAIGVLYSIGYAIRPRLWTVAGPKEDIRRARWLAAASLVAGAATFINPYGWALHQHLFAYLTNTELLSRVAEFQSFNFHLAGAFQVWLTLLVCFLGVSAAWAARHPGRFLVGLLFAGIALRSARGLPVAALLLLPLSNASLVSCLRSVQNLQPRVRKMLDGFLSYSANLRILDSQFRGWAVAPAVIVFGFWILGTPGFAARTGFDPKEFPVAASVAVEKLPGDARLLSTDKFGGYLIYRFQGRRKVFFDGRSDFYGVSMMKGYLQMIEARPGWRETLGQYRFSHALLPSGLPLREALQHSGWRTLYSDGVACLLEAPRGEE